MFMFHISQALCLIALAVGVVLIAKSCSHADDSCKGALKFFGYLIAILAIINLGCSSYASYKYWKAGYYDMPMMMKMMDQKGMNNPNAKVK
jgi:hypothetical protein